MQEPTEPELTTQVQNFLYNFWLIDSKYDCFIQNSDAPDDQFKNQANAGVSFIPYKIIFVLYTVSFDLYSILYS